MIWSTCLRERAVPAGATTAPQSPAPCKRDEKVPSFCIPFRFGRSQIVKANPEDIAPLPHGDDGAESPCGQPGVLNSIKCWLGWGKKPWPLPPDDVFYGIKLTPDDLKDYELGQVVKWREIFLTPFFGLDADRLKAWQLLFVTTGGPKASPYKQVTVTTIIVPPNSKGDRVIAYQPKTNSASSLWRTSYALRAGGSQSSNSMSELVFLGPMLDRGWICAVSDYLGQNDAFGAGLQSGHAVLDGIRAVMEFSQLKLDRVNLRVVGYGYSGGAIATGFAAQLARSYAPDVEAKMQGWCLGGLPVDLKQIAMHVNNTLVAGVIVGVVQGLANTYPQLQQYLADSLTSAASNFFSQAKLTGFWSVVRASAGADILGLISGNTSSDPSYFKPTFDLMTDKVPAMVMEENRMGADPKQVPRKPLLIACSLHDEIVPIKAPDELVERWGKGGATIEYIRDQLSAHALLSFTSYSACVRWMGERLEGKANEAKAGKPWIRNLTTTLTDDGDEELLGKRRYDDLKNTCERRQRENFWC
ncbi:Lipase, secreted [Ceraceosorus bombacis]|uniref:triacylglycerol lipase n=1 Tax=Ceraceosorus bombacis TaxID=401625 RepID=A0A0N7L9G2_9BASI|nr:Lipase, secreted [Ceraceosorus bombacis]